MGKASANPLGHVRKVLRGYADRGVFRSFSEAPGTGGGSEFKFLWLCERPVRLLWNSKTATLTFRDFLPGVPARSAMYSDLKKFVKGRSNASLPRHRRIDARRAEAGYRNRDGNVSISLKVKGRHFEYGANRAINLINEIYMGFLHDRYYDYLVENFDLPDE